LSPEAGYEVLWTATALEMLGDVADRRTRQQLFDSSKRLEADPEKQGKPLRESLMGFRTLRVVGQRYRLVYSIEPGVRLVHIVAAGLRREASRDDVYELAQKIVRLGLAPPPRSRRAGAMPAVRRKKKK
jgi:mRNA interferase RelE/StbE